MKHKELLQSLHWSMQQTAILLLAVLGMTAGLSNFADIMHADPNGNADLSSAFMKMLLGNAIGIILFVWYSRRKRTYLEEHKNDHDDTKRNDPR